MKKIRNIGQLKARKAHLKKRQSELEKAIKYDWLDLKESLRPGNVASQVLSSVFKKKETENGHSSFKDNLSMLANRLMVKLAEKAEDRIEEWLKK